jgi:hypothetical protein
VKNLLSVFIALALVLSLVAVPAAAQEIDLAGTWKLSVLGKTPLEADGGSLEFARDGHELKILFRHAGGETDCIGYIDDNQLHFYYIKPERKEDLIAKFSGHVRGDLMGGEIDMGRKGTATWMATRAEELETDLSGTWTLTMKGESPSGMDRVKMRFRQDGPNLVVTLLGEDEEIDCEGYIEGRTIRFYYVRPAGEGQFVARFTGQMAGAIMGGEVDMGEMGTTTWRASKDIEI